MLTDRMWVQVQDVLWQRVATKPWGGQRGFLINLRWIISVLAPRR